ncbi:MAG: hypothetical protein QN157_00870 [Armatimonadota bacterium]|nr:hypothetical protein [Armatimonadota bacterium]
MRLVEPPISTVLAFDTSGSMGGAIQDLKAAATAYVDAIQPRSKWRSSASALTARTEIVVLTERFTNDRAMLHTTPAVTPTRRSVSASGGTTRRASPESSPPVPTVVTKDQRD